MVIFISLIAYLIPNFNAILDLIGCIPCLWTMYFFPPLCHYIFVRNMATVPNHIKWRDIILAAFSFVISIVVLGITIYEYTK